MMAHSGPLYLELRRNVGVPWWLVRVIGWRSSVDVMLILLDLSSLMSWSELQYRECSLSIVLRLEDHCLTKIYRWFVFGQGRECPVGAQTTQSVGVFPIFPRKMTTQKFTRLNRWFLSSSRSIPVLMYVGNRGVLRWRALRAYPYT